jgi:hypothetical protein
MFQLFDLFSVVCCSKCFMLQVQTAGVGVDEDDGAKLQPPTQEEGAWCGRDEGESSGRHGRDERGASVEKTEASHHDGMGSGAEASDPNAGMRNRDGANGARIQADGRSRHGR